MTMRRYAIAAVVIFATAALQAATTYRVTTIVRGRLKQIPSVERVIADGDNRRLTIEQQDEPFTHDVLLSADGGKTITALNTPLRTWFDFTVLGSPSRLKPRRAAEIKDPKVTVWEESGNEPILGFPVRKFVVRASFTSQENYGGTKVKRENAMTKLVWTTDKIEATLAFPADVFVTGVRSIDAELRQKTAAIISGFPLREVTTFSQAYEGGAPSVETITTEVDDIRTVPSPPVTQFAKPAGYVNQPPIISGAPLVISH